MRNELETTDSEEDVNFIEEALWSDEKYRKCCYGLKLMQQSEETARAHGCAMMHKGDV